MASLQQLCRKTRICRFHVVGLCTRGDACAFAHGEEEVRAPPDFHRTKLCPSLLRGGCFDPECTFAHNAAELRSPHYGRGQPRQEPDTRSVRQARDFVRNEFPGGLPYEFPVGLTRPPQGPPAMPGGPLPGLTGRRNPWPSPVPPAFGGQAPLFGAGLDGGGASSVPFSLSAALAADEVLAPEIPAPPVPPPPEPAGPLPTPPPPPKLAAVAPPPPTPASAAAALLWAQWLMPGALEDVEIDHFKAAPVPVEKIATDMTLALGLIKDTPVTVESTSMAADSSLSRQSTTDYGSLSRQSTVDSAPALGWQSSPAYVGGISGMSNGCKEENEYETEYEDDGPYAGVAQQMHLQQVQTEAAEADDQAKAVEASEPGQGAALSERPKRNRFHKTRMCTFHVRGVCHKGVKCNFAHSEDELKPQPDLHCTKLCPVMLAGEECTTEGCTFAHSKEELRVYNGEEIQNRKVSFCETTTKVPTSQFDSEEPKGDDTNMAFDEDEEDDLNSDVESLDFGPSGKSSNWGRQTTEDPSLAAVRMLRVKNTFLDFEEDDNTAAAPPLRRSSSAPCLLGNSASANGEEEVAGSSRRPSQAEPFRLPEPPLPALLLSAEAGARGLDDGQLPAWPAAAQP